MEFTETTFALGPKHRHHEFAKTFELTEAEQTQLEHVHKELLRRVHALDPAEAPHKWHQLVDLATPYDLLTERGLARFHSERGGARGDPEKVFYDCRKGTQTKRDVILCGRHRRNVSEKLYEGLFSVANWGKEWRPPANDPTTTSEEDR